jgi:hypothetical protein
MSKNKPEVVNPAEIAAYKKMQEYLDLIGELYDSWKKLPMGHKVAIGAGVTAAIGLIILVASLSAGALYPAVAGGIILFLGGLIAAEAILHHNITNTAPASPSM